MSFPYRPGNSWPSRASLVLKDNTVFELGGAGGSQFMILWTNDQALLNPGQIILAGTDLPEAKGFTLPLTQVVIVRSSCHDQYETYRFLRDAIFDNVLDGVSFRYWPDRQKIWCRVNQEALSKGFNLQRYGNTLLGRLYDLYQIEEAEIIISTEQPKYLSLLHQAGFKAQESMEMLMKINDRLDYK